MRIMRSTSVAVSVVSAAGAGLRAQAENATPTPIVGFDETAAMILADVGLASLDAGQRHQLADRFASLFEALRSETADEYLTLMQSWGGRYRIDPASREFQLSLTADWNPAESDCAIRSMDASGVRCTVIQGVDENGRLAPWGSIEQGAMMQVAFSVFTFGGGSFELAKSGQPVAQVMIPVEMNDGLQLTLGVRFVWEPETGAWVPWLLYQSGRPLCIQLF